MHEKDYLKERDEIVERISKVALDEKLSTAERNEKLKELKEEKEILDMKRPPKGRYDRY